MSLLVYQMKSHHWMDLRQRQKELEAKELVDVWFVCGPMLPAAVFVQRIDSVRQQLDLSLRKQTEPGRI